MLQYSYVLVTCSSHCTVCKNVSHIHRSIVTLKTIRYSRQKSKKTTKFSHCITTIQTNPQTLGCFVLLKEQHTFTAQRISSGITFGVRAKGDVTISSRGSSHESSTLGQNCSVPRIVTVGRTQFIIDSCCLSRLRTLDRAE